MDGEMIVNLSMFPPKRKSSKKYYKFLKYCWGFDPAPSR